MSKFEVRYVGNKVFSFHTANGGKAFEVRYGYSGDVNYNGSVISAREIDKMIKVCSGFKQYSAESAQKQKEHDESAMEYAKKHSGPRVISDATIARNAEIARIAGIIRERVARGHNKTASAMMMGTAVSHVADTFKVDRGIAYEAVEKAKNVT